MAPSLSLDPREKLLKDCLVECAHGLPPLEIRFAGGWVRDKLLGHQSKDIDAALSTLSGKDFGQFFLEFYEQNGAKYKEEATRLGIDNMELNKIVLVEEDAEKSKHLAVAKMKLFGLEVDLVNLRTEVYASDSRTPVMKMGTAKEDALRRDATINALFYNLQTEQVEDLTGRGLQDMENKIMRTPLEPYQTFRDDPLRVLRLIRFASRLDFEIDPTAQLAMKDPQIHQALKSKISRERVRAEIIKALEGPGPAKALLYIHELNLFSSCFAQPMDPTPPSPDRLPQTYESLIKIMTNSFLSTSLQLKTPNTLALPWLLAAYTPWSSLPPKQASLAIKEGLKATVRESKLLSACITHLPQITSLISAVSTSPPETNQPTRGQIGMSLRLWGPTYPHQILFALLCNPQLTTNADVETFLHHLETLDLQGTKALDQKPILDGREIKKILFPTSEKGGPANKVAAEMVMEWGFDHQGAGKEECAEMLRGRKGEILGKGVVGRDVE